MEFRLATMKEYDEVCNLYKKTIDYLETHINYPKWHYDSYPSPQTIMDVIKKKEQFIAVDNGKVLGAVVFNKNPDGDYESDGRWSLQLKIGEYYVIHAFTTDLDSRNTGVGTFIINSAIDICKKENIKAIRIDAVSENYPAQEFYKNRGFKIVGEGDLGRNIPWIKTFKLLELVID